MSCVRMLRRYTWEKVREECQHYRRRRPEVSTLYQVVYHTRQSLEYAWTERFQPAYGSLRAEVLQVYDEYLNCGVDCSRMAWRGRTVIAASILYL